MTYRLSRLSVAALTLFAIPLGAMAANKVDLRHAQGLLNQVQSMPKASVQDLQSAQAANSQGHALRQALGLAASNGMQLKRQNTDRSTGDLNLHFTQTFKGVPVWGHSVVVTKNADGTVRWMHGNAIQNLAGDVASAKPALSSKEALKRVKDLDALGGQSGQRLLARDAQPRFFRNESSKLQIFVDDQNQAHLAYVVSYFSDRMGGGAPERPVYIIDANSGAVLKHFDKLMTNRVGTGPGGNQKTGEYYYGTDYPKLDLTVSGSTYSYNNSDVRTVDLNNGTSGTTTFTNNSSDYTPSMTNGAYAPINDAQYMGGEIVRMYQDWIGTNPLSFKLVMRVHYDNNYENAFWDGNYMNFGDGASTFYPLVCFDVAGHEVSHGYTEQHSNLTYSGKSGGINEAFSDMAGEATENHAKGSNDWMVGKDIYKGSGALRYMDNPPQDGNSIDNVADYYSGLNVHYSSGIFNKAFYELATTSGWSTQKAFKVMAYANANYWTADATFQSAAQGVEDAASALGYSTTDVDNAFSVVGIDLGSGGGGGGSGSCPSGYTQYTGSLSGSGSSAYEPNGNYYQSTTSGTHSGVLSGPSGSDFDLYLQKWNGSSWVDVDSSTSSTSSEQVDYSGSSGYYVWEVYSYSGSGNYSLCIKHPN